MKLGIVCGIAMLAFAGTPAFAQQTQTPTAGIVLGSGSSIGILWHASENMALRPEVSISKSTNDFTTVTSASSSTTSTTDTWTTGFGGSLLFYTAKWDNLRAYISPRLIYSRAKSTNSVSGETTSKSFSTSGSVGAQYGLGSRFAVYGEVGLAFAWTPDTTSSSGTTKSSAHSIGTRSTIGGVWYF